MPCREWEEELYEGVVCGTHLMPRRLRVVHHGFRVVASRRGHVTRSYWAKQDLARAQGEGGGGNGGMRGCGRCGRVCAHPVPRHAFEVGDQEEVGVDCTHPVPHHSVGAR
jgi:hypothetical protein